MPDKKLKKNICSGWILKMLIADFNHHYFIFFVELIPPFFLKEEIFFLHYAFI